MSFGSFIKSVLPLSVRKYLFTWYADRLFDEAMQKADELARKDGHRYYVLPTKSGNLKVTNVDIETRDPSRLNDKRLLKRSVRKPYQLRKESFYFTASKYCNKKYNPEGMLQWEVDAMRMKYHDWYFLKRFHK